MKYISFLFFFFELKESVEGMPADGADDMIHGRVYGTEHEWLKVIRNGSN